MRRESRPRFGGRLRGCSFHRDLRMSCVPNRSIRKEADGKKLSMIDQQHLHWRLRSFPPIAEGRYSSELSLPRVNWATLWHPRARSPSTCASLSTPRAELPFEAPSSCHSDEARQPGSEQPEWGRFGCRNGRSGQRRDRWLGTSVTSAPKHDIVAGSPGETIASHAGQHVVSWPPE